MIKVRPYDSLGGTHHGWLDTKHHFSFGDYYDPQRMHWVALRVWPGRHLMGGIGLMIRGLYREATMSTSRWRRIVDAYGAPQVSKATIQKLDAIVMEYVQRDIRHGGRSRTSKSD